jgi:N4-gp56 family major capsid protein
MAETQLNMASRVQKWNAQFFAEYVRDNLFTPYMGRVSRNAMMPFLATYELSSGGKTINIPLITRLKGGGVFGTERLTGNEEALGNFNKPITIQWARHGVTIKKPEEHWTEMDLREAARTMLRVRASEALRDDQITALMAFDGTSYVLGRDASLEAGAYLTPLQIYQAASEGAKDAWLAANSDRVLFGAAVANNNANDHSASLLNVDATADRMSTSIISLAKIIAKESDPKIRPFRVENAQGREYYVLFVGTRGMRDLKRDTAMLNANREARERNVGSNPIFQDGDLIYDGIIIREIPEIPVLGAVGAGGDLVAPAFLCGAQSVGIAWGQEPSSNIKKEDDYGFEYGVAVTECRGVSKLIYNGKQHGMVTIYHAAPATAAA